MRAAAAPETAELKRVSANRIQTAAAFSAGLARVENPGGGEVVVKTDDRGRTVPRPRASVEDAGGQFTGLVALTAKAEARSVLMDESDARSLITYHSTIAARTWEGPADEAIQWSVHHVTEAVGTLLKDHAVPFALQLLLEIAATGHPEALSPEMAANIRGQVEG